MDSHTCAPSLSDLTKEKASGQLRLAFDDEREQRKMGLEAFIDLKTFFTLPSRDQQAIAQAVTLFEFLEHKESITFGLAAVDPRQGVQRESCELSIGAWVCAV